MYSLRLLGGISLEGPSGPLTGRVVQHRQLAVLALLAAAQGKGCSRDKLIAYIWPDSDAERGRHSLSDSIYIVRKALGEDALLTSGDTLRLNHEAVWCDVTAFEEAFDRGNRQVAEDLYGGPFLDGFHLVEAGEFEHWLDIERDRLATQYAEVLESLAAAAEEARDYTKAVGWWQRLAIHDPYNSRIALHLMQALAAAGDRANALQYAQDHIRLLEEELGIEPDEDVLALVQRLKRQPTPEGRLLIDELTPPAVAPPRPTVTAHRSRRPRAVILGVAAALALVTAITVTWRALQKESTRNSIAVLPFHNLTPDPGNDYLAAGFHEEIVGQLAKISSIRVIGRMSVMEYKDNPKSANVIASELDVDHILEGSVRSEGDRLRITVQLIDPRHGEHLWAENYDRPRSNMLGVQEEVAQQVAQAMEARLTTRERTQLAEPPTQNPDAYDYYLRGTHFHEQLDRRRAVQMYERSIELDSTFALAYARLASAQSNLYSWYLDRTEDRLAKARIAVERALELQPDLLEAHLALYAFRSAQRDRRGAMEALARARELAPNDSRVHRLLGIAVRRTGQFRESAEHLDRALEYSPRWRTLLMNAAVTALYRREYSAAQQYLNRGFEISPQSGSLGEYTALLHVNWDGDLEKAWQGYQLYCQRQNPRVPNPTWSHWRAVARILHHHYQEALRQHTLATFSPDTLRYFYLKAISYQQTDEMELARAYADSGRVVIEERLARISDDDPFQDQRYRGGHLAYFYALLGMADEAIREAETGVQLLPDSLDTIEAPIRVGALAEVYVMVGEHEAAIDQLEHLLSIPSFTSVRQLELDPIWDPLRDHPRFQALLTRS